MKKNLVNIILIIIDIITIVLTFYLTVNILNVDIKIKDFSFILVTLFFLLYFEKIYQIRYDFWQDIKKVYKVLFLTYFISLSYISITSINFPLNFINLYFFNLAILFPIIKRYSKKIFYLYEPFKLKVILIGNYKQIELFKKEIENNWYLGMKYDDIEYESAIVSSKYMSTEQMNQIITDFLTYNSKLFIIPYISQTNFANSTIIEYSNIRLNTIQIENKLLLKSNIILKEIFDLVGAFFILPFFIIIHIVISILIKFDSKGKILFKQKRIGKDGKIFTCYKYRTMYENSEEILKNYLKNNPQEIENYKKYHKYKNDPRITRIGKFLRISSLDEIPQIFNVLKQEMSLIGPRPYMIKELDNLYEKKGFIFKIKPGITGLWQVSGRNNLTFKERIEIDIWYIKNWSLWSDFVILIKTIKVVLFKIGAK